MPPNRTTLPPDPNTPIFGQASNLSKRSSSVITKRQHAGDNIMNPPYAINNALPELSDRTAYVRNRLLIVRVFVIDATPIGEHNSRQWAPDV